MPFKLSLIVTDFGKIMLKKMVKNAIMQVVIQLTEVELTTWSIIFKSRPSGQASGRVGSFFGFF